MAAVRLQKFLADAGLASRREAERWIADGRIKVNGEVVTKLGTKVEESDRVLVDEKPVRRSDKLVYYLFYKPKNVMVTRKDPQGRPTVYDYFKKIPERLFPVGRLDFDSEGLLLLTNDGDLAHRWMHPRSKVSKVYSVELDRSPTDQDLEKLRAGIQLEEGRATVARVTRRGPTGLEVTLTEGKRRQIRRMLSTIGLEVRRLVRVQIGPFSLGKMTPGQWQRVPGDEIPRN